MGNELNEQLETVQRKVLILLSQKEKIIKHSKDDNSDLKEEILQLNRESKYKEEKIIIMTKIA